VIDWRLFSRPSSERKNCNELCVTRDARSSIQGRFGVISLEDCIALSGLTEQEVMAIAEHEHVPEIAAAAIGRYLLKKPKGPEKIRDMIRDDIHDALGRGDKDHASELLMTLRHFLATHPEAKTKSIS
jgi:hypothetical protein